MLTFHRVSFGYQESDTVLKDVSFTLPVGTCTLLAGRNGSGKSTIVQLANGLLRPRSGEVRIRGVSTMEQPTTDIVRDVGVMFQHPGDQLTERTITREVEVGVRALQLDHPNERVRAAIDLVELHERADTHPYDLEPAERKLVTLASIVAMHTPVVLLDEPLVGLGPGATRIVENVVRQLRHEGRTVLIVVHDVVQAWLVADRVVVLDRGTVSLEAPLDGELDSGSVLRSAGMKPPASERFSRSFARTQP